MEASLPGLEGKYQILAKLREGGMGAIYKVRHRLLDEVRVVKVMKPQLAGDATFAERFLREAQAAAKLRHRNIAQVYDFAVGEDGAAYIVMEYIDGIDLGQLLKRDQLPPVATVLEIGVQALDALEFLHAHQFVHRDISPDNLMIRDDPRGGTEVKLIDLGIAKQLGQGGGMTQAGEFLGKFHYASPEHFGGTSGQTPVEPRSDLYSLGLVLYELLTGERPYLGQDFSALTAAHLLKPPRAFDETDPGDRVSPPLRSLVLRALEKDPADRFGSAAAMRRALEAARADVRDEGPGWTVSRTLLLDRSEKEGEAETVVPGSTQDRLDREFPRGEASARAAVTAEPGPPAEPSASPPPSRRSPWPWVAGALALLGALGLVAWLVVGSGAPRRPELEAQRVAGDGEASDPAAAWEIEADEGAVAPLPAPEAEVAPEVRLAAMRDAHEALQRAEAADRPATAKAEAWRRFLDTYGEDVPETAEDEEIRAYARRRLGYWEGRAAAEAAVAEERAEAAEAAREAAASDVGTPPTAPPPADTGPPTRDAAAGVRTQEEARRFLAARGVPISEDSLRQAIARDEPQAVRIILLAGPGIKPGILEDILEAALEHSRLRIVGAFLEAGVRPKENALEKAAGDGRLDVVRLLVGHGIGDRREALEDALDDRHWQVARYLVDEAGVSLSEFDDEAEDLLVDMAERGELEAVAWLLRAGVDARGDAGEDALDEAESNDHADVAALIRRARGER